MRSKTFPYGDVLGYAHGGLGKKTMDNKKRLIIMDKKLTTNDIAKMSGVAKSTVSRYLNGDSVRDATSQKIKKVIEEHNYEPNVFAWLSAKSSKIIGLIVPGFNSVTTPHLVEVIVAYLKSQSYTPLIMHTGNDVDEELRSIERLKNINVDGIMVLATSVTDKHRVLVETSNIPILFLGQKFPEGNSVINDDYGAGLEMGEYLGSQGASKVVGLWVSERDPAVGKERKRGIIDGLKRYGISPMEFVETSFFYQDAAANIAKILDREERPDTIICATDRIAQGVYKSCYQRKIKIPEEISVTGFGDYETSELLVPSLTTVRFDLKGWGEVSAETMIQMINGKAVSKLQTNSYQIMKRGSVMVRKNKTI